MRTSRCRRWRDISLFVMMTVGRLLVASSQIVTGGDDLETLCRPGQDCRLISQCPAVLKLVFKVGSNNQPTILCLSIINYDVTSSIKYLRRSHHFTYTYISHTGVIVTGVACFF